MNFADMDNPLSFNNAHCRELFILNEHQQRSLLCDIVVARAWGTPNMHLVYPLHKPNRLLAKVIFDSFEKA